MSQNLPFSSGPQPSTATPQQNPLLPQNQSPAMATPTQNGAGASSGDNMAALMSQLGVTPDQMAKIAFAIQSGQLTLPPALPHPANLVAPATAVSTPTHAPPPPPSSDPRLRAQLPAAQDVDMDKEDGEVEEGEVDDEPAARAFLQTPPKGPRNRSRSPLPRFRAAQDSRRSSQQSHRARSPYPQTASGKLPALSRNNSSSAASGTYASAATHGDASASSKTRRHAAAKDFLRIAHSNGHTYDDVAKNISNRKLLRRLYNDLGLPTEPQRPPPATHLPQSTTSAGKSSLLEPQSKTSLPKKVAPTKPAALDRTAYLAKLQAAKNKKSEPAPVSASPSVTSDKPAQTAAPAAPVAPPVKPTPATVPTLAKTVASKNELIKQRMAALAAERAAKEELKRKAAEAQAKNDIVATSSDEPAQQSSAAATPGLGAGIADAAARASTLAAGSMTLSARPNVTAPAPPPTASPQQAWHQQTASPMINRGAGLPGLFTTGSPMSPASFQRQQMSSLLGPAHPPTPPAFSRHQNPTPHIAAAQKRPFAHVDSAADERVIIVDSDDEEGEDDIEIDYEDDTVRSIPATNGIITSNADSTKEPVVKPPLVRLNTGSAPGTPGTPGTPRGLNEVETELAAMRRRLAEVENKKRRKTGSAGHAQLVADEKISTRAVVSASVAEVAAPTIPQAAVAHLEPATASSTAPVVPPQHLSIGSESAAPDQSADSSEKLRLAARMRELQAQGFMPDFKLPTFDISNIGAASAPSAEHASVDTDTTAPPAVEVDAALSNALEDTADHDDDFDDLYEPEAEPSTDQPAPPVSQQQVSAHIHTIDHNVSEEELNDEDDLDDLYEPDLAPEPSAPEVSNVNAATVVTDMQDNGPSSTNHAVDPANPLSAGQESSAPGLGQLAPQTSYVTGEAEDELDDDDLEDVYAQPHESVAEAAGKTTKSEEATTAADEQQDESDDAMDTSGDSPDSSSDDDDDDDDGSEEEYEPGPAAAGSAPEEDSNRTSSELNHGADLQMRAEAAQVSRAPSVSGSSEDADAHALPKVGTQEHALTNPNRAGDSLANATIADDDTAPELRLAARDVVVAQEEPPSPKHAFKPYESPLIRFKDFRYHPEFRASVKGGHRSLTYSNHIDPNTTVCPFETAGGQCAAKDCPHQHFRDMGITDNDLLRLIGADRKPTTNEEEEQRWKAGLTAVVQKLRESKVGKDVDAIANKISEYRREFLGDPTKTLVFK